MIKFLEIIIISAAVSFLAHDSFEKLLSKMGRRTPKIVFRNYHIHHSFWGALIIILAPILATGALLFALLGYGLGNIWQHKRAHNSVAEKGWVFISKIIDKDKVS